MLMIGFMLVITMVVGVGYWGGSEIASPSRRPLMDYHREFLANPSNHGIRIDSYTTIDCTPCLIVTPDMGRGLKTRGMIIREQLASRGHALSPAGEIVGTLVLVHGRKGRKEDYLPIAERLCATGFRCVIPDLPAHGAHPENHATYGIREGEMLNRLLREVSAYHGFPLEPAGLLGMSMGGAAAIHAAARDDAPWRALVIISSFDSLQPVIEMQVSKFVGNHLGSFYCHLAGWTYDRKTGIRLDAIQPHRHASSLAIPTLIAHGTDDQVVSITAGRQLFAALPEDIPKQWIEVPGADHENVLITDFPIYAEIAQWMLRHLAIR